MRGLASMSLKNMIRNTLLGNEGSTPRAKGMQAVSVSKICEGHVSRISQRQLAERELEQRSKTRADLRGKTFQKNPS